MFMSSAGSDFKSGRPVVVNPVHRPRKMIAIHNKSEKAATVRPASGALRSLSQRCIVRAAVSSNINILMPARTSSSHFRPEEKVVVIHRGVRDEHQEPGKDGQCKGRPCPFQNIRCNSTERTASRSNTQQPQIDDGNCAENHRQSQNVTGFDKRKQIERIADSYLRPGMTSRNERASAIVMLLLHAFGDKDQLPQTLS